MVSLIIDSVKSGWVIILSQLLKANNLPLIGKLFAFAFSWIIYFDFKDRSAKAEQVVGQMGLSRANNTATVLGA
ncbi:hypothetical protein Lpp27_03152, partial [Lacticaseibacillus paracasei subsp. paracasei CNCM I-4648]